MAAFEGWRSVVGFEQQYEVSDRGRVRRVGRAARHGAGRGGGARVGRIIATKIVRNGYVSVQLWRDGRCAGLLVHRLVAQAFIGPIPDGHEVNHIDGVKTNNTAPNLEFVTRSGNLVHAYRLGLRQKRYNTEVAAPIIAVDPDVVRRLRSVYAEVGSMASAARRVGLPRTTAQHILNGRTWRHVI